MNLERIYFSPPYLSSEESDSVKSAIDSGWVAPVGPALNQFETELSKRFANLPVLALNSGTSALHLAMILSGVSAGDTVVVGSLTFVAAANGVMYQQGVPVFLDSEPRSWNLNPQMLEQYLTAHQGSRSFPKAVIVTHIYGRAAKIKEIALICTKYKIKLIEDAAEAFGTLVDDQSVGTFGDFGVLSFNGNKIITTGGGGALICKRQEDYDRGLSLSTQSKAKADHYLHDELGYNYRLSNVLAAIGLAQLSRVDAIFDAKRRISNAYSEDLKEINWLELVHEGSQNYWISLVLIRREYISQINPSVLIELFEKENIEARRFWKPLHAQPLFAKHEKVVNGVSDDLFERGFCLPSGAGMSQLQQERVVSVLKGIML